MLMSMSSTGIAPSRKWLTMAQNHRSSDGRQAPIWANVWTLETGYQDNEAGSYYQITKIDRLGYVTEAARAIVVPAFLDVQNLSSKEILGVDAEAKTPEMKSAEATHTASSPAPRAQAKPASEKEELF